MKKIAAFFIFLLLPTLPVHAATDQKTIDFLEKLNRYYYCLSREGLKSFSTDVSFAFTPEYEASFPNVSTKQAYLSAIDQLKFTVACSLDGTPSATTNLPPSTGNVNLDAAISKSASGLRETAEGAVQTWSEIMFKPLHDQKTYASDCKVKNNATGFTVTEISQEGSLTEYYDSQAKLYGSSGILNGTSITNKNNYSKTTNGFLITNTELNASGMKMNLKIEYKTEGGFLLPQRMVCDVSGPQLPNGGLSFVLTFSNYKLNQ